METKQPQGLSVLFMTEVWERFGFYIAQGLLVLYMTHEFKFSDVECFRILGAFTALAYVMPVAGGYIADKILGFRRAVIWGGVLLCIGYAALAVTSENTFYYALAVIVLGTGFFKPNVSSMVGTLYGVDDPRRDSGFTIFYIGINLGIIFSTLFSGFIQQQFGWRTIFLLASVGMIIALTTFIRGGKKFNDQRSLLAISYLQYAILVLMIVSMLTLSVLLLSNSNLADSVFAIITLLLFAILFLIIVRQEKVQRQKSTLLMFLTIVSMFFWALYFQLFTSLTLFVDRDVARQIFGFEIPAVAFLALVSIYIVIFGAILTKVWTTLKRRGKDLSLPVKFAYGMLLPGVGFLILVVGTYFPNAQGLVLPLWVILGYLFVALGELFLSPIGLSMVTELAPARLVGMLMGVWFFSLGVGGQLSGVIAGWAAIPKDVTEIAMQIVLYRHAFLVYAAIGIVIGVLVLIIYKLSHIVLRRVD